MNPRPSTPKPNCDHGFARALRVGSRSASGRALGFRVEHVGSRLRVQSSSCPSGKSTLHSEASIL